jgi:hypothetical protein
LLTADADINNTLTTNGLFSSLLKNYPVCQQHFAEVCIDVRTGRLLRYSLPTIYLAGIMLNDVLMLINTFLDKKFQIPKLISVIIELLIRFIVTATGHRTYINRLDSNTVQTFSSAYHKFVHNKIHIILYSFRKNNVCVSNAKE